MKRGNRFVYSSCNFYITDYLEEGLEKALVQGGQMGKQIRSKSVPQPDPDLEVGSLVEVMSSKPLYGVIRWIGHLPDQKEPTKPIAGLEMVCAMITMLTHYLICQF